MSRINLCLGDWIFWPGKDSYNFRGALSAWDDYFRNFIIANKVTDIILVGEQRKYHNSAIKIAQQHRVKVNVTDFGYTRPDWITLERDGMNGTSHMPRSIDKIKKINENQDAVDLKKIYSDSEIKMIIGDIFYSFCTMFDLFFFPRYTRSDMRQSPAKGLFFSLIRWSKLLINYQKTKAFTKLVESGNFIFFLFTMQLEHDFQIVAYSKYTDLEEPLRKVIKSFSENSKKGINLIIKNHPCDSGLKNWRKIVYRLAEEYGIREKVFFVDGGTSVDTFINHASGLVCVNSTCGLRSLILGCPVKNLSHAIYGIEGLTFQGELDEFWSNPPAVNKDNVKSFINVVVNKLQVRGVFFNEPGCSHGIKEFADRLCSGNVGI